MKNIDNKFILLILLMQSLLAISADAETTTVYSYASEIRGAHSLGSAVPIGTEVYNCVEFAKDEQYGYAGARIVGMVITTGCSADSINKVRRVRPFIVDSLSKVPSVGAEVVVTDSAFAEQTLMLADAVEISALKNLYVGYNFTLESECGYIPTDNESVAIRSALVGTAPDRKTVPEFISLSNDLGSIGIKLIIEGDDLPQRCCVIKDMQIAPYFTPNNKIVYTIDVLNNGIYNINSVNVTTRMGKTGSYDRNISLTNSLAPGKMTRIEVRNVPNPDEGIYKITSHVKKINAKEIPYYVIYEGVYSSYEQGYIRNPLTAIAVSRTDGESPLGLCLGDYLERKYEQRSIVVNVHESDEMAMSGNSLSSKYSNRIPFAVVNGQKVLSLTKDENIAETGDELYLYSSIHPAYAKIDVWPHWVSNGEGLYIRSQSTFSYSTEIGHELVYIVTEDNVGPYVQSNNFAGVGMQMMEDWTNEPSDVEKIYNNVARVIVKPEKGSNIFPKQIEADVPYEHEVYVSLLSTAGESKRGDKRLKIIGAIVNSESGEIINASRVSLSPSGIGETVQEEKHIDIVDGYIQTSGYSQIRVWKTDGTMVKSDRLEPGLYIIQTDEEVRKIYVK